MVLKILTSGGFGVLSAANKKELLHAEIDALPGGSLLQDYTTNNVTQNVTGLVSSRPYYFAVVVRDTDATGNAVYSISISGANVCAAGDFTSIGGQPRGRLACLDSSNATATSWNPGSAGIARTLAVSNSNILAGGDFGMVNGWVRNNLAAITMSSGYPTA